jgi:hypothetical protein
MVWASSRAIVSDGPPAEKGTMMVITLEGYSWAFAWVSPRKRIAQISSRKALSTMVHLPVGKVMNKLQYFENWLAGALKS